ncbi:membrane dipeptidase [Halomarina salina]|uniref:Membrane dipeptidase n=1 Tax=Halomarina salina TaxID=1872699 RepID=A0ABD5RIC2_9EURY
MRSIPLEVPHPPEPLAPSPRTGAQGRSARSTSGATRATSTCRARGQVRWRRTTSGTSRTEIGVEHVALGSGLGGCAVPASVGGVTDVPGALDELRQNGFERTATETIAHDNWLRVPDETWRTEEWDDVLQR